MFVLLLSDLAARDTGDSSFLCKHFKAAMMNCSWFKDLSVCPISSCCVALFMHFFSSPDFILVKLSVKVLIHPDPEVEKLELG